MPARRLPSPTATGHGSGHGSSAGQDAVVGSSRLENRAEIQEDAATAGQEARVQEAEEHGAGAAGEESGVEGG